MPTPTAMPAATRSGTSRAARPLHLPTLAGLGLRARGDAARRADARRAAGGVGPHGRAIARQGLGDRALGADGSGSRAAVSDVPRRVSGRTHRRVRARASAGRCSATSSRRAPRSSTSSARAPCAPATRSSTPRPTACSRSPRTRTSCRSPRLYDWCQTAYDAGGGGRRTRPRHRAAVRRRARGLPAHGPNRHDYAMPPPRDTLLDRADRRWRAGDRGREGRRPLRRPRHHHSRPTISDDDGLDALEAVLDECRPGFVFANLVDFDTQYGHRNDVAGFAANLERFDARLAAILAASRRRRPAGRSPPITATIRRRRAPTIRASTCRCWCSARVCGRACLSGCAPPSPISGRRWPRGSASAPLAHGTSFLEQIR